MMGVTPQITITPTVSPEMTVAATGYTPHRARRR